MFGKDVIGGGNLYSGYSGVPGGRTNGRFGKPGKPGKVSIAVGAKSFRVATAECMAESDKLRMNKPATNKRENAISCNVRLWSKKTRNKS